jgi:hypothetical protein
MYLFLLRKITFYEKGGRDKQFRDCLLLMIMKLFSLVLLKITFQGKV